MVYYIVIVGDGGVGKTSLTSQFLFNYFSFEYDPNIEHSFRKQICVDHQTCYIEIIDFTGQGEPSMRDHWLRKGHGFILIYSITSSDSFDEIEVLREQILRVKDCNQVPMVLVGNKCDLENERQINTHDASWYADLHSIPFFETSTKNIINVDESFFELVRVIRIEYDNLLNRPQKKKRGKCQLI